MDEGGVLMSVEELNNRPYSGSSAQSQGMTGADFQTQYLQHGGPFRWLEAYPVQGSGWQGPNGEVPTRQNIIYVERDLDAAVKCMLYETERDWLDVEGNALLPKGQTGISVIPSQVEFSRNDRIILTGVSWAAKAGIAHGAETDPLPRPYVTTIDLIMRQEGSMVDAADYEVTETGIHWLNRPAIGTKLFVKWHYHPLFEWLGRDKAVVQKGADGQYLPQRGIIRQVQPVK